jgi:ankyrin repeat protein
VRLLLRAGAEVHAKDDDGRTPLMWAAHGRTALAGRGHPQIVQALLEAGADPKARDEEGNTAASWAAYNESAGIIELLGSATASTP